MSHIHLFSKHWVNNHATLLARALLATLMLANAPAWAADGPEAHPFQSEAACSSNESWKMNGAISKAVEAEFKSLLQNKSSAPRSFSEAMALRILAANAEVKMFAEYWISRTFYDAGLYEIALQGFNTLLKEEPNRAHFGIQLAALECLNTLNAKFPTLKLAKSAEDNFPAFFKKEFQTSKSAPILLEAAARLFLEKVSQNLDRKNEGVSVPEFLKLFKPEGNIVEGYFKGLGSVRREFKNYERFAQGIWAVRQARHDEVIQQFVPLLNEKDLPKIIALQKEQIRLFLARSYYASGRYTDSVKQYRLIGKDSPDISEYLSELSWAQLMAGNYPEAIGLGVSVQSGWMKKTFTPEPLMVSSIALNEICHYPEALRMVQLFLREYSEPHNWLEKHQSPSAEGGHPLYSMALAFLKLPADSDAPSNGQVPNRVVREWLRSPVFISQQEGINLIFEQNKSALNIGKTGQRIQKEQTLGLLTEVRALRESYKLAKIRLKPGEELPSSIQSQLNTLRSDFTHYDRLVEAGPIWRAVLAHYKTRVNKKQTELVAHVEDELLSLNQRMYDQLNEIMKNNELIEVEIYNGASSDIVFKNAHPNYKNENKDDAKEGRTVATSGEIYNWGNATSALNGSGEIWADELDSLKANLENHCPTKKR